METPLDSAHSDMHAAPDDDRARLRFFERLADGELFVLLATEAGEAGSGLQIFPEIFRVEGGRYVLAFDREERLAAFTGGPAPYAALPGRALATMLAGEGLGLGLNLGATSETLLPAEALEWLAATLGQEWPEELEARPEKVLPPVGLPPGLPASATRAGAAATCSPSSTPHLAPRAHWPAPSPRRSPSPESRSARSMSPSSTPPTRPSPGSPA
jgi:hypothetical protein